MGFWSRSLEGAFGWFPHSRRTGQFTLEISWLRFTVHKSKPTRCQLGGGENNAVNRVLSDCLLKFSAHSSCLLFVALPLT